MRFHPRPAESASFLRARAIEAVNWGIPAVNYDRMAQAMLQVGGRFNQIVYWSRLPDWKNQALTPNPDVIYLMPFIDTKDVGPVVLEIPPADDGTFTGSIMDGWQGALEDVGPAGVDEGKGGKYLVLPPEATYRDRAEAPAGYIVLSASTYRSYALLRSILRSRSEADVARAVAYAKRVRVYPLAQASHPDPTAFVDVADTVFDATIPYDLRFFESLHRVVQIEPWSVRDKVMIDVLASIGIEKGTPFDPDERMKTLLREAAVEAKGWLAERFETAFSPYYEDRRWVVVAPLAVMETMGTFFEKPDVYAVDARGVFYSYAFATPKHLGAGQFYLFTLRDREERFLYGRNDYRLRIPANVPAKQYWSAVVYDLSTYTFIRGVSRLGRSSQSADLRPNPDGSIDLYFGRKPPPDGESNWIPTGDSRRFIVCLRFYGPEASLFDKTWKPDDMVLVNEFRWK